MSLTCGGEPDLYRRTRVKENGRGRGRGRDCAGYVLHARRESNKSKGECSGYAPTLSVKNAIALEQ